jgi:hypothetical protein
MLAGKGTLIDGAVYDDEHNFNYEVESLPPK